MKDVNGSRIAILAIDDEAEVLSRITAIVEEAGYDCCGVRDAQSAHEAVRRATPDLIIVDVNLAGHSGLTLCEQLKQQAGIREIPVLFLSSAQGPDIIRRSHATGGAYYLRKPFDATVLLQLIEKACLVPHLAGA
jgi:CheY-like chemotaxis protein